jgi:hypothetical protein
LFPNFSDKDTAAASDILQYMYNIYESGQVKLKPTTSICNSVINSWINNNNNNSKSNNFSGRGVNVALKAQAMLKEMERSSTTKPDTITYNTVIKGWSKSNGGVEAAIEAEKLLQIMLQKGGRVKPDVITYSSVIYCWAKSGHPDAAIQAERILEDMIQRSSTSSHHPRPNTQTFSIVIYAWAKSFHPNAADKAQEILSNMEQMYLSSLADMNKGNRNNNYVAQPNSITYTTVINALAKSGGGADAARKAEQLLDRMYQLYENGTNISLKPTIVTYAAVIDCWAKSGLEEMAAERADAILENLIHLYQSDPKKHADLRPNTSVFNTVINAWAKCSRNGAFRAHKMLSTMEQLYKDGIFDTKPDKISYGTVMNAFVKSGSGVDAAIMVEQLLDKMQKLYDAGDVSMRPDAYAYGSVISLWSRIESVNHAAAAERADAILTNMIRLHQSNPRKHADLCPDAQLFSYVISAYAKIGGSKAAHRALTLLTNMETMCKSMPNAITYTTVIKALSKSGDGASAAEEAEKILQRMTQMYKSGVVNTKPDVVTYNAVINCWAQSNHPNATMRAESILTDMIRNYQSDPIKNADLSPDTQIFSTVINVWAQQQHHSPLGNTQAAMKAQSLLTDMEQLYEDGISNAIPNSITYTTVIKAWAKSGDGEHAAMEAEKLLKKMHELHNLGSEYVHLKPDVVTYNAVINCWAQLHKPDAASRAEEILTDMIKTYQSDPVANAQLKPDAQIFNSAINAWAKSGAETAALRAQALLNDMENFFNEGVFDTKPDRKTYSTVIDTWTKSGYDGEHAKVEVEKLIYKLKQLDDAANLKFQCSH